MGDRYMSRQLTSGVLGRKDHINALRFNIDVSNQDVLIASNSHLNARAVSFWFKVDVLSGRVGLLSGIFPDRLIIFRSGGGGIGWSNQSLTDGKNGIPVLAESFVWNHLVCINGVNDLPLRAYFNNELYDYSDLVSDSGWRSDLNISMAGVTCNLPLKGSITSVNVFDREITAGEVDSLYKKKNTLITDGLIARWDFSEGQGNTLGDYNNIYNGTIRNNPEWIKV